MSSDYGPGIVPIQAAKIVNGVREEMNLPFSTSFDEPSLSASIMEYFPSYRDRIFTPQITLFAWLAQVLSADKSCREAVARVNEDRIANGLKPAAATTPSFCEARGRLVEGFIHKHAYLIGLNLERDTPRGWFKRDRSVKVIDGSTFTMEDTQENQAEFPQCPSQAKGAGFPIARMVAVMSLATGAILDAAFGPYEGKKTGEHALLRRLLHCFEQGDIVLGDGYYGAYFLVAKLRSMAVDCAFRMHGARDVDFRRGQRLGRGDHLVIWKKPPRPDWMSEEEYALYADAMVVREVRFSIDIKGFRSKQIVLVTTLVDVKQYQKNHLSDLYRWRWMAEVNLRTIKSIMKMEHIRCMTPQMVAKDFWVHLLAYNLIRKLMAQAAWLHHRYPWQISFKGTVQTLNAYKNLWKYGAANPEVILKLLMDAIIQHVVGNRPGRYEPRAQKRRPKPYPFLKGRRRDIRKAMV